MPQTASSKNVVWFSRILRWGLGIVFMATGFLYYAEGGWPVIVFGAVFFATGFFSPRRCTDGTCNLPGNSVSFKENNIQTKQ
ncbi:DUF2892 domain-containing protein [Agriterribacter sp.]|uniref:YgaP family membrane protein n=1 Tax=Agriterribacter sp. TaxID=2821509 RepID=UPI002CABC2DB|nr:DUF2892 domain-containing protein [Agriterribacter sp.]HRP55534.1 DUF2892 domain-containing protein [Agriterribacter sp.]